MLARVENGRSAVETSLTPSEEVQRADEAVARARQDFEAAQKRWLEACRHQTDTRQRWWNEQRKDRAFG